MGHHRLSALTAATALLAVAALPAAAQAATWGGPSTGGTPNVNYVYPNVTILFKKVDDRVNLLNYQLLMQCTDRSDGYESIAAFSAGAPTGYTGRMQGNQLQMHFVSNSGGRTGATTLTARMRPNGTGRARVEVNAVGRDSSTGGIVDDCFAEVTFRLQKFRPGRAPADAP